MRTAPALLICLVAVLALNGCVPDDGPIVVDPEPSSSSSPIFESDEEALAAAEEAFSAYLMVVDQILADGGTNSQRLAEVATASVVEQDEIGFASNREQGRRSVGTTTYDTLSLQQVDLFAPQGEPAVIVYVCEDFSGKDVLDSSGNSVVSPDRQTRWPLVVGFERNDDGALPLLVASVEDWDGDDFCAES